MPQFVNGETVLCFQGPLLYEAKLVKSEITEDNYTRYLIHYVGWEKSFDEWVPESRIVKYNITNVQRQKELSAKYGESPGKSKRKSDITNGNMKKKTKYVNDTEEQEFACTSCNVAFSSQSEVDEHWQWHILQLEHMQSCCVQIDRIEIFRCDFCTRCFPDVAKMRRHEEKCFKNRKKVDKTIEEQNKTRVSHFKTSPFLSDLGKDLHVLQRKCDADITLAEVEKDMINELNEMSENEITKKLENKINNTNQNKMNKLEEKQPCKVEEKGGSSQIDQNKTYEKNENKSNKTDQNKNNMGENKTIMMHQDEINEVNETVSKEKGENKNTVRENEPNSCNHNELNKMIDSETYVVEHSGSCKNGENGTYEIDVIEKENVVENGINSIDKNNTKIHQNKIYENKIANIVENRTSNVHTNEINEIDQNKMDENKTDKNGKTNNINKKYNMDENESNGINTIIENNTNKMNQNKRDEIEAKNVDENETNNINENIDNTNEIAENRMDEKETIKKQDEYDDENEGNKIIGNGINNMNEKKTKTIDENESDSLNDNENKMNDDITEIDQYEDETKTPMKEENMQINNQNESYKFQDKKRYYSYISRAKLVKSPLDKHLGIDNLQLEYMQSCFVKLSQVKIIKCEFCESCFPDLEKLRTHQKKYFRRDLPSSKGSSNEMDKPYKCEVCGWRFMVKSTLQDHSVLHQPFQNMCECGVGYYKKCDLDAHRKLVHPSYKPPKPAPNPPPTKIKREPSPETKPHKLGPRLEASLTFKRCKTKKKNKNKIRIKLANPTRQKRKINKLDLETDENGYYTCAICSKKFIILDELVVHLYTDHSEKDGSGYRCKICGKTAARPNSLKLHMFSHAGMRPYLCDICNKGYSQHGALVLHKKRHTGDKQFTCGYCNKSFYNSSYLRIHLRTHTGEKPYECKDCGKAFADPSAYKRHTLIHTGLKPHQCQICSKAFCDPASLYRHKRLHKGYRVQCTACERTFSSKTMMLNHHRINHTKEEVKYECDHCGFKCHFKKYLVIHITNMHANPAPEVECEICCKKFASNSLKMHIKTVHLKITRYECDKCGRRFYHKSALTKHKLTVHRSKTIEKTCECDYCHSMFYSKFDLQRHICSIHLGIVCRICKKSFTTSLSLKRHKAEGCSRCGVCNKPFKDDHYMRQHFISKHSHVSEQQMYECDYCGKQFPIKPSLLRHIQQHMRRTDAFRCDHCGKGFSARRSMVNHIFSKHMLTLYCNVCMKRFTRESEFVEHKRAASCRRPEVTCTICNKTVPAKYLRHHMLYHGPKNLECDLCGCKFRGRSSLIRHFRLVHNHKA